MLLFIFNFLEKKYKFWSKKKQALPSDERARKSQLITSLAKGFVIIIPKLTKRYIGSTYFA